MGTSNNKPRERTPDVLSTGTATESKFPGQMNPDIFSKVIGSDDEPVQEPENIDIEIPDSDPEPEPELDKKGHPEKALEHDWDVDEETDEEFMEEYNELDVGELIVKGYITHTAEIIPGFNVTLRTLKKGESLEVDKRASLYRGVGQYIINEIALDALAISVQSINGRPLGEDVEEKKARLGGLAEVVVMELWEQYKNLQKASVILLKGDSDNPLARRLLGQGQTFA